MTSKLRKALGAVKDQTTIGLAKVSNKSASALEIAILKSTTRDKIPIDEDLVTEILTLVSTNRTYAAACAVLISKRISRTKNWIVVLKSLILVLRIFQDGDPYFPREVFHTMKRGSKILNLSSFKDDTNSEYTVFVRDVALYLDDRLDCILTGKLRRRSADRDSNQEPEIRDMKPAMLLSKIMNWQRLLDRAIAAKPSAATKSNKLVRFTLYAIVQESFDLYNDISVALGLLLDSYFHLQYHSCLSAFQACVKASKQFDQLIEFYEFCKTNGIGRPSEYPSVHNISDDLIESLHDFLKDESSFVENDLPSPKLTGPEISNESEMCSDFGSYCTSVDDLDESGMTSPTCSSGAFTFDDTDLNHSLSIGLDSVLDDWPEDSAEQNLEQEQELGNIWDIVTREDHNSANQQSMDFPIKIEDQIFHNLYESRSYNPFLDDEIEIETSATNMPPTSQVTQITSPVMAPTFSAHDPSKADPFSDDAFADQQTVMQEQELWLHNQNKIISKHLSS